MINVLDALSPTIILSLCAVITLPIINVIRRKNRRHKVLTAIWMVAPFIIAMFGAINLAQKYYINVDSQPFVFISITAEKESYVSSSFLIDAVSIYMVTVYLVMGFILCLYGSLYVKFEERLSERYFALLLIVIGSVIAATLSGDLLTLFIFWEASAVGSCFLIVYGRRADSIEASLKYLVMIVIASGFIVYGLSIIYSLVGSLNFWAVREALTVLPNKNLILSAFLFVAAGYAIETAVVPFHMWLPDAYTAAPSSSAAFLSAIVDQASYYVFMRVLLYILTPPAVLNWPPALSIFSALTMTIGNIFALAQRNIKRMIAYVCVADIGYNLVAITSVKPLGVMGNLFFFFVGGMTTALAFMAVGVMNRRGIETLEDFSGVGRKMPLTSLALTVTALSFSGIPPFAGFIAKYLVFTAAIEAGMAWLAIVGVLNSVLQSAYLLRLIHYMYSKKAVGDSSLKEPKELLIPVYLATIAIIVLGLYPSLALELIKPVASQLSLLTS
ncbi:TPA: NADH-quinone oxidoreductase subunit N [Candidatus Bathyarchaeota archaeon]|nr:NADH-quinone oxidoreductase subunit N [Candidatus Bathyarchaeota archaeon]